jgi:hypothetical protein
MREGIQLSETITGDGGAIFRNACGLGLEGILSKRIASRYVSGRTRAWLKTKNPNFRRRIIYSRSRTITSSLGAILSGPSRNDVVTNDWAEALDEELSEKATISRRGRAYAFSSPRQPICSPWLEKLSFRGNRDK